MIKHILYIILLFCGTVLMAQNNAIFGGGNSDGYDKANYLQSLPLTVAFLGGNGDGYTQDCYRQTKSLTVAFSGGNNDGYTQNSYTQQPNLNNIFSGGIGGNGILNGCANEPLGCVLNFNLGNDTVFCYGQTLILDAGLYSNAVNYLWQDNSTNQTFLVDTTGIYYVTVIDTVGCIGIDSIIIALSPHPVVNLGNDTAFCEGGSLVLDAQNTGTTYQWQNGVTTLFLNQIFTVTTTGQYFVKVTNGACSTLDTINVIVNPIVTTSLSNSYICQGDSLLMFGKYETLEGIYQDTILASTGCDSILVQQLFVNLNSNNNLETVSICEGDSVLMFGIYQSITGTYQEIYFGTNTCDSIVYQDLIVNTLPVINLGIDTIICEKDSILLTAGTSANFYTWNTGDTTQTIFVVGNTLTIGIHTYQVQGADTNGCIISDTVTVEISACTGINELDKVKYNLYPNPTKGNVTIISGKMMERIKLYNILGEKVMDKKVLNNTIDFNIKHFPKGMYVVTIIFNESSLSKKLILK